MIKHIVFFKLSDKSDDNKELVKKRLLTMKLKINILNNIEVGLNFSNEDRAYDIVLITGFNSKDDFKNYAVDPYHIEIVAYMKSVAVSSKVVDFKY